MQREKNEKLQRLRMEAEAANRDLTFKPAITKVSNSLVMRRADLAHCSVTERLCRDAAERVEKSFKQSEIITQQRSVQYPFAPQLQTSTSIHSTVSYSRLE